MLEPYVKLGCEQLNSRSALFILSKHPITLRHLSCRERR